MNFIVVDTYSLYIAIVGRPWLHVLGAVFSTLYVKMKSRDRIEELIGSQSMARQCLVVAILHQPRAEPSAFAETGSLQSKTPMSPASRPVGEAKCEGLEKIIVGDDPEMFFRLELSCLPRRRKS